MTDSESNNPQLARIEELRRTIRSSLNSLDRHFPGLGGGADEVAIAADCDLLLSLTTDHNPPHEFEEIMNRNYCTRCGFSVEIAGL